MAKKSTPLKDEQLYSIDDLYQKLDDALQAINKLADQKSHDIESRNATKVEAEAITTRNFAEQLRKGYQILKNEYVVEQKGLLFDEDLENIGKSFKTQYSEFTKDLIKHGKANSEAERKHLDEVFDAHEIRTMEQMEGWASKYSVPVRCWMRWLGKNIFDDDEPKETVQEALKVIGDCMMAAEGNPKMCPESEPTFPLYCSTSGAK